jgi:hypothetical protein
MLWVVCTIVPKCIKEEGESQVEKSLLSKVLCCEELPLY